MNSLTKQRYISTSIWSDDWFDSLSECEKLVYFYLLTNEHTNPAGVYQCTLKNVRLEIGLDRHEIESIMGKFAAAGKAFYYKDYIIIPKWLKHQKIKERSGLFLGACKVLKSLPDDVKAFISDRLHYDYDITDIIGTVSRPSIDPLHKKETPSIEFPDDIGEHPPKSTAKAPHDSDLDLDSELDIDIEFDVDTEADPPLREQYVQNSAKKAPTTNFLYIQGIAKDNGFFISEKQAQQYLTLPKDWLSGNFTFVQFAALKIHEDTSKSKSDLERIFAKAWSYQNLLDEYPAWKTKQKKKAVIAQRELKREQARENIPKICPNCGGKIESKRCEQCNGILIFDEDKLVYDFNVYTDTGFSEEWKKMLREKHNQSKEKENNEILSDNDNIEF